MTKEANSPHKPSPSDTPTHRPDDKGGKSKVREQDQQYKSDEPHGGYIAKKREQDEQPVNPVKDPPKEKGMEKGKVQP